MSKEIRKFLNTTSGKRKLNCAVSVGTTLRRTGCQRTAQEN